MWSTESQSVNKLRFIGSRKMVQIADRLVDYNENFQLYLFSNNADLTLSSDQSVLLSIVNFTLNHIGLTEQVCTFTCINVMYLTLFYLASTARAKSTKS